MSHYYVFFAAFSCFVSQWLFSSKFVQDLFALSSNNGEPPNNNDIQELFNEAQRSKAPELL